MSFFRRRSSGPPQLFPLFKPLTIEEQRKGKKYPDNVGLITDEALSALQRFLRHSFHVIEGGLPPGQFTGIPTEVQAGVDGEPGDPSLGWSTGLHKHPVETASAVDLTHLPSAEGSSTALARADHLHQRAIEIEDDGVSVGVVHVVNVQSPYLDAVIAPTATGFGVTLSVNPFALETFGG